ncbi:MAG TPA: ABC transporter permease [Pseudolabrys sp.]|jgi:ABC-type nitrate/sulfonate/bicarbonate transport system permease component
MKRVPGWIVDVISVGFLLLIWHVITYLNLVPRTFVPSPIAVYGKIVTGLIEGMLLEQTTNTVLSMLFGWLTCSLLGIVVGCIIGIWPFARRAIAPVLEIFRPMPPAAVIPVAIAIFGLTREMSLAVIVFGAVWPALLATVHGFSSIEPRLQEVGRALEISPFSFIWKIALPNATPDIIAGMRLSMVISLVLAVITDMITGQIGLGSLVVLASRTFDMAGLFAGLVLLSLIGFISNGLLQLAERRLLLYR